MIIQDHSLEISTKCLAFSRIQFVRSKIVMNSQSVEVQSFIFLGCELTHLTEENTDWKITRFNSVSIVQL